MPAEARPRPGRRRRPPAGSLERCVALLSLLGALTVGRLEAQVCGIPGKDGPGGVLTGVVNTYFPGVTANLGAGSTSIVIGGATGAAIAITPGDLLIVMQMQDADIDSNNTSNYGASNGTGAGATNLNGTGRYEYVVATNSVGLGGGTLSIRGEGGGGGLVYSYRSAAATSSAGRRSYQVVRVPQYSSATLSAGLTAAYWNGATGGILAIDVAGGLILAGTVNVDGRGFRGGAGRGLTGGGGGSNTDFRNQATNAFHGSKGEGIAGTPRYVHDPSTGTTVNTGVEGYPNGSHARGAPGTAGGGGTDGNTSANDQNSGGGGGSNGGAGGLGGNTWSSNLARGGRGGASFPAAAGRLALGGGGGAGSRNNSSGTASHGGAGGGIVIIRAGTVTGAGTISASGLPGNTPANDGGGGGGAGGSVVVYAASGGLAGLVVLARGGDGGNADVGGANHGPGGGGGGGFVALSSGATVDVAGGAAGYTVTPGNLYGATAGTAGLSVTGVSASSFPGVDPSPSCVPQLTVTKTTSTPAVTNGPTGTTASYTITVVNAAGRDTARTVTISDTLPTGFTYASHSPPTLAGGASRPSTGNPTVGDAVPSWTSFRIPGGGSVTLTFVANVAATVPAGTYQNPAAAIYLDPGRTTPAGTTSSRYDPASSTGEDVTVNPDPDIGTVTGHVFRDPNGDGVQQAGEPDLAGVDVVVTDTTGATQTVTTNANGDYSAVVPKGGTTVDVTDPANALLTTANDPQTVSVPGGGSVAASPVGFQFLTGTVTGLVFEDADGDGVQDPGEGGLANVDVIVTNGAFVDTVTTNASGVWTATDVPIGTATVDVDDGTLPAGMVQTAGSDPSTVTVPSGGTVDAGADGYQAQADVEVTKSGPASAEKEGTIFYIITTTNHGPATAVNVVVTDSMPPSSLARFESASRGATLSGRLVTWPAISLAPGATIVDTLEVRVEGEQGDPPLVNVARVTSSTADPDSANNRSQVTTTITDNKVADLDVTKTGPTTALLGDTLLYVIVTRNLGTENVDDLRVRDTLPAGVTFLSANRGATLSGNVVTWPTVQLDNGATRTDSVRVVATSAGAQQDVAVATSSETDPDPSNNDGSNPSGRVTTQVSLSADLGITKTDGVTSVVQGGAVTYTIVTSNAGPHAVIGATVDDAFPAALTGVTWTCVGGGGGSCGSASGSGDITGATVDLPVGASATFTATGTASGTGTLVNTATVTVPAGATDPDPSDNSATDDDTQILVPGVSVTPDGVATLRLLPSNGTSYSYTFTVANTGSGADQFDLYAFPNGGASFLTVDSIAGANVTRGARADSARSGSIAAGGSDAASLWFDIADVVAGSRDSLYLKAISVLDPAATDSGWVYVEVVKPAIATAKGVSPTGTQPPGTNLTYTVTLTNQGTADAVAVAVVDSLPPEVEFVVGSDTSNLPAGIGVATEYSDDGGATWTYVPTSGGCGAAATYDRCVQRIRWTLQDPLGPTAPDNTGTFEFVARIR